MAASVSAVRAASRNRPLTAYTLRLPHSAAVFAQHHCHHIRTRTVWHYSVYTQLPLTFSHSHTHIVVGSNTLFVSSPAAAATGRLPRPLPPPRCVSQGALSVLLAVNVLAMTGFVGMAHRTADVTKSVPTFTEVCSVAGAVNALTPLGAYRRCLCLVAHPLMCALHSLPRMHFP